MFGSAAMNDESTREPTYFRRRLSEQRQALYYRQHSEAIVSDLNIDSSLTKLDEYNNFSQESLDDLYNCRDISKPMTLDDDANDDQSVISKCSSTESTLYRDYQERLLEFTQKLRYFLYFLAPIVAKRIGIVIIKRVLSLLHGPV